ncbi:hypothetical protein ACFQ0B_32970 [Nonomuraea thailandensis]
MVLFAVFYLGPLLVGIGMSFTDIRSTDVTDPSASTWSASTTTCGS